MNSDIFRLGNLFCETGSHLIIAEEHSLPLALLASCSRMKEAKLHMLYHSGTPFVSSKGLTYHRLSDYSVSGLTEEIRSIVRNGGADAIIGVTFEKGSYISSSSALAIAKLSCSEELPIVVVQNVSTNKYKRDHHPKLDRLRNGRMLSEIFDNIFLTYRDEYWNHRTTLPGIIEVLRYREMKKLLVPTGEVIDTLGILNVPCNVDHHDVFAD